jgi:hypothetical protein
MIIITIIILIIIMMMMIIIIIMIMIMIIMCLCGPALAAVRAHSAGLFTLASRTCGLLFGRHANLSYDRTIHLRMFPGLGAGPESWYPI